MHEFFFCIKSFSDQVADLCNSNTHLCKGAITPKASTLYSTKHTNKQKTSVDFTHFTVSKTATIL